MWSDGQKKKKQNLSLFFFLSFFSLVSGRRLARSSLLSCICTMLRGVEAGVTAPTMLGRRIPDPDPWVRGELTPSPLLMRFWPPAPVIGTGPGRPAKGPRGLADRLAQALGSSSFQKDSGYSKKDSCSTVAAQYHKTAHETSTSQQILASRFEPRQPILSC